MRLGYRLRRSEAAPSPRGVSGGERELAARQIAMMGASVTGWAVIGSPFASQARREQLPVVPASLR